MTETTAYDRNYSNYAESLEGKLFKRLSELAPLGILVSGGADSTLLSEASRRVISKEALYLYHAILPFSPHKETERIKAYAEAYNLNLIQIKINLLERNEIVSNSKEKCYFCKKYIITSVINSGLIPENLTLCDGTVSDDYGDYRPGLQAASEFSIQHPLADSGFGKREVRLLSRYYNLPDWNLPASACLASRIPVNQIITESKLKKIAQAEDYLTSLGFSGCRVRYINNNTARIEVFPIYLNRLKRNYDVIKKELIRTGFREIIIDENGYKKGAMNSSEQTELF
jgi:uncharacterized protein